MDIPRTSAPDSTAHQAAAPASHSGADLQSTGVMKALVLVDDLREQRKNADVARLAALMRRR